jgi:hypothetical protein
MRKKQIYIWSNQTVSTCSLYTPAFLQKFLFFPELGASFTSLFLEIFLVSFPISFSLFLVQPNKISASASMLGGEEAGVVAEIRNRLSVSHTCIISVNFCNTPNEKMKHCQYSVLKVKILGCNWEGPGSLALKYLLFPCIWNKFKRWFCSFKKIFDNYVLLYIKFENIQQMYMWFHRYFA